jgi:A/G-specific adenine glycosylase
LRIRSIRSALTGWYERVKRDLPWRRTHDPYAIWISEIMLQQTRVAAAIPYYERFLEAFPDSQALARAPQERVLALWSGLGYYTRVRNLQKAARQMNGTFPRDYDSIRGLPGIGNYTAAAVASIAFGLPHAAVDGNVRRVIVRLTNDDAAAVPDVAARLLDRSDPGRWNQAVMELGATVCLPRDPRCGECPVVRYCEAHRANRQNQLPSKRARRMPEQLRRTLLLIRRRGAVLLEPSSRVKGFWDLPEEVSGARMGETLGEFRHTITHRQYHFVVRAANVDRAPKVCRWFADGELDEIPLSTTAKKALRCSE